MNPAHFVIVMPKRRSLNGYSVQVTMRSLDAMDSQVREWLFSPRFSNLRGTVSGLPSNLTGLDLELAQKLIIMMMSADQIDDPKTVTIISITLLRHYVTDRCFWIEGEALDNGDWNISYQSVIAGQDPILALKQVPLIAEINNETGKLDEVIDLGTVTKL